MFILPDGRETAVLSLWGPHAAKFEAESDSLIQLGSKAPVVLLFAGVTMKIFNNRLALQCSSVCRWYINPLLPETTLLQQSYGAVDAPPHRIGEERKSEHQTTTVKELAKLTNPHEVQGNKYVVVAKIKELQPDQPWWYMAYTTYKSGTKFDRQHYSCRNPTCNSTGGIERYRITFLAEDPDSIDSSEVEMVEIICFSPLGDELTGIAADKLVNVTSRVQGFIPEQLTRLYGQKFEFHLSVQKKALENERTSFKLDLFSRVLQTETDNSNADASGVAPTTAAIQASTPPKDVLEHAQLEIVVPTPNAKEPSRFPRYEHRKETLDDSDTEESLPKTKKNPHKQEALHVVR